MWAVAFTLAFCALLSVLYDIYTYESRQAKWEKEHPGQEYVWNYRKLTRQ